MSDEVEFHEAIRMAIPPLAMLLNDHSDDVRSATVSALVKLVDHGEFVAVCCPDIANTSVKSSFVRPLGRTSQGSLRC
jgi:HEAT repeat protein